MISWLVKLKLAKGVVNIATTDGKILIKPKEDLTGKKFGKLLVIKQGPDIIYGKWRKSAWCCKCECGNTEEILVQGSYLINGHTKSCGCLKHETKDLTNQKFGKLTVIRRADDIIYGKIHYIAWWCKCDCGNPNEVRVRAKNLVEGTAKSCGCLYIENQFKKNYNTYDLSGDYGKGYTYDDTEFLFDNEDYDLIKNYSWHTITSSTGDKYVVCQQANKINVFLSRLVMGISGVDFKEGYVDHINGNPLDNRKCNLRIVTPSQNSMNSKLKSNNTSGVTGVYWNKVTSKWFSLIIKNKQRINLGTYANFEDAVKARKEAEEKYFGEYSYDNSRNREAT